MQHTILSADEPANLTNSGVADQPMSEQQSTTIGLTAKSPLLKVMLVNRLKCAPQNGETVIEPFRSQVTAALEIKCGNIPFWEFLGRKLVQDKRIVAFIPTRCNTGYGFQVDYYLQLLSAQPCFYSLQELAQAMIETNVEDLKSVGMCMMNASTEDFVAAGKIKEYSSLEPDYWFNWRQREQSRSSTQTSSGLYYQQYQPPVFPDDLRPDNCCTLL